MAVWSVDTVVWKRQICTSILPFHTGNLKQPVKLSPLECRRWWSALISWGVTSFKNVLSKTMLRSVIIRKWAAPHMHSTCACLFVAPERERNDCVRAWLPTVCLTLCQTHWQAVKSLTCKTHLIPHGNICLPLLCKETAQNSELAISIFTWLSRLTARLAELDCWNHSPNCQNSLLSHKSASIPADESFSASSPLL